MQVDLLGRREMTIWTFSGTHDFDPTVLVDTDAYEQGTADEIIDNIEHGRCPRREGRCPPRPSTRPGLGSPHAGRHPSGDRAHAPT